MYSKYILLFFFQSILCLYIPENYSEYFKNATSNVPNVTEIEEKVKAYEKDFLLLYKKAIKPRAMLCDLIEKNIKSIEEIKNKYASFDNLVIGGTVNSSDWKKFLELRGDIFFGRRNIDIAIDKLKSFKEYCFNNTSELEKYIEEFRKKNQNKKEILDAVNKFVQMDNGL